MAAGFYIQMPPTQTPKPSSRRLPLTPSSVSPPSLTTHNSCAARRDAAAHTPANATAILTRMASHSSRSNSHSASSAPHSPAEERQSINSDDASDYWDRDRKEGGYISFPDFEKYCSTGQNGDRYADERT